MNIIKALHTLKLYKLAKSITEFMAPLNPVYVRRRRAMKSFYTGFIREGDVCFDIGANIGNRTEVFLDIGARVIAVEPQQACVRKLEKKFGNDPQITIVHAALGETEGEAELMVSSSSTISSLSKEWIDTVKASGRFSDYRWDSTETVRVTTFDCLIGKYGVPAFTKIDVEGFEASVLKGLSQPAGVVSFEFTPEYITSAIDSIRHLETLGTAVFNHTIGETMKLVLDEWVSAEEICRILTTFPDTSIFGDVYARFKR